MSSHFNYEIDEHKLQEKLRGMVVPTREDSWTQFETYSDLNRSAHKPGKLPSIQLNINRTLILPFVFGGVIILFSLLLFNFISIKNKNVAVSTPKKDLTEVKAAPVHETPHVAVKTQELKKDTVIAPPVVTPTIVATPTVSDKPPVEEKVATTTPVAAVPANTDAWIATEPAKIYVSPNIASEVLSHASANQSYAVIDQTTYFVKISFVKDGKPAEGYIRKDYMRKPGQAGSGPSTQRRSRKKAETLQSITTPVMLSNGSGEEPELK